MEDHEIIHELMDQNILQQDEIERLQREFQGGHDERDQDDRGSHQMDDHVDENDYDHNHQQGDENFGGWDNSDDNWV